MTYWSLRALGNSAFPIAFSQEPLQPVIARKLNGIGSLCVPGSYVRRTESRECKAAWPRRRMLCRHSKKAK